MRILALTRYGNLGASSRVRFLQYIQHLKKLGVDVNVSPFFSNEYVREFQEKGYRSKCRAIFAIIRRLVTILMAKDYDAIWIEKELIPWAPYFLEKIFLTKSIPYILDYDDAVYHYYDKHNSWLIRRLLSKKHTHLIKNAEIIFCGNEYIAEYAKKFNAKNIQIIPTTIDLDNYSCGIKSPSIQGEPIVVGWIGQPHNTKYLKNLSRVISQLSELIPIKFSAIGADSRLLQDLPVVCIKWRENNEVDQIHKFDVGIMPLPDEAFERGKCGYKLIQYMACGLPIIASPVGVNVNIVEHGVNGFLATNDSEWAAAILKLASSSELRYEMGLSGRNKVESLYSVQVIAPRIASLFLSIARSN